METAQKVKSRENALISVGSPTDKDDRIDFNELEISDDCIDPRVQIELEKLNSATDAINKLEVELDEARASFRQLLSESSQRINSLAKKLGNCIEKARPYYEARIQAKDAHTETQKAALRFERANSAHAAAKEMVFLAEEGLQKEGRTFDPAWQEMLNHATMRVNEAERERTFSEQEHRQTSFTYNEVEQKVQQMQKDLKRAISKSSLSTRRNLLQLNSLAYQHQLLLLPYFEMKAQFNQMMEEQKQQVQQLEEQIFYMKQSYSFALHNLEEISDEIHQRRQKKQLRQVLGSRGPGVGAESPIPLVPERESIDSNINLNINTDDTYMRLPKTIGIGLLNCKSTHGIELSPKKDSGDMALSVRTELKNISHVDHGIQTDNIVPENVLFPKDLNFVSGREKMPDERVSVWVQESGLQSQLGARRTPRLNSHEHGHPGLAAAMFFNVHEDSDMSDAESLNSTDVLTDEQIANLMLDRDLEEAYQDIIIGGTRAKENSMKNAEVFQRDFFLCNGKTPCISSSDSGVASNESVNRKKKALRDLVCVEEIPLATEDTEQAYIQNSFSLMKEVECSNNHITTQISSFLPQSDANKNVPAKANHYMGNRKLSESTVNISHPSKKLASTISEHFRHELQISLDKSGVHLSSLAEANKLQISPDDHNCAAPNLDKNNAVLSELTRDPPFLEARNHTEN